MRATSEALATLLPARRSVRALRPDPVPEEEVRAVIDAARHAPSPHNSQPWRFVVLRARAAKERLADAMAQAWRADLMRDGLPRAEVDAQLERSRGRIVGAPVTIVVLLDPTLGQSYPDERRRAAESAMAMHAIGAAVHGLMLAATSRGLATCWMCAPLFCSEVVTACLGLPDFLRAQALVALGYAESVPRPRGRRPLSEIVLFDDGAS